MNTHATCPVKSGILVLTPDCKGGTNVFLNVRHIINRFIIKFWSFNVSLVLTLEVRLFCDVCRKIELFFHSKIKFCPLRYLCSCSVCQAGHSAQPGQVPGRGGLLQLAACIQRRPLSCWAVLLGWQCVWCCLHCPQLSSRRR